MDVVIFDIQYFASDVKLTAKNDEYSNSESDQIIYALSGNDKIFNVSDNVTINGDANNDLIINGQFFARGGTNVELNGGNDNDTITNSGSYSKIDGGAGDDLIHNGYYYYEPWNAYYNNSGSDGAYDDKLKSSYTTIYGGSGNDSIYNRADNVTIDASTGNNYIYSEGSNVTITGKTGADSINSEGNKVKINSGAGNDSIRNYGSNVTINAGTGNDYVYSEGSNVTIIGEAGSDSISSEGDKVKINSGAGNDSIRNYGSNVTINAGTGNNYIYSYGSKVVVNVDGGKNTIEGDNIKINGGKNNDSISCDGKNITINGGTGNDTLTGDRYTDVFQYYNGGGDDVITNYSGEDVIHIASGKINSYSFDGGDLIFKVGSGSLRLKNMKNHAITVKDSSGKTSTKIYGTGYSGQQVIKNFVKSMANTVLDSKLKLDEAIQACSGFKSLKEVNNKMVADCRKVGNAEIFLKDYCGIITDNDDRDAAIGWDAGGLKMKTQSDLFPQSGSAVYPSSTTFNISGLKITVPEKSTLSEKGQLVVQGFYSWWAKDAIKLIEDTYGFSFKGKSMKLSFFNDDTSSAWGYGDSYGVRLNLAYTSFDASDKNGNGLGDFLFPHEMTHVLQGNFNILSYMPRYMIEGMADLTGGITRDMSKLASDSSLLAKCLDVDNSSYVNDYVAGYMFWRYLMKQAADSYDSLGSYAWKNKSSIKGTSKADLLTQSGKYMTVSGGNGKDTITAYGKNSKINGDGGNDQIWVGSTAKKLTISGGTGNDKIYNYSSKSTLKGEAGNDFIINGQYFEDEHGGQKVVIDGGIGNDTITSHGKNSVLKGGNGNDLIYNGFRYYEPWTAFYDYDDKNYKGDNTTITGGKGNDTVSLSSYAVNNVINYASGDGKDTVFGFDSNDTLHITKGNYSAKAVGSDVIVTVGKGSICLKDAANKKISIKNSRNNITKKNYKDTSVADLWIEDNFVISDDLSGIVKNNLSPTDDSFESQNFNTLNQKDLIFGQSYLNGTCERK